MQETAKENAAGVCRISIKVSRLLALTNRSLKKVHYSTDPFRITIKASTLFQYNYYYFSIEHRLTDLFFLLFSSFFCPFVRYWLKSTVFSTPSKSPFSRGGYFIREGSAPTSNPLPFIYHSFQKRHAFRIPFIGKRHPFHIPS